MFPERALKKTNKKGQAQAQAVNCFVVVVVFAAAVAVFFFFFFFGGG